MTLVEWMPTFETGIAEIDDQHRQLVGILNRLFDAYAANHSHEILTAIIQELCEYTETHFSTEERYMEEAGYSKLAEHQELHRDLTAQVLELEQELVAGHRVVTRDVIDFLNDWLTNHILEEDREFGRCFRQHRSD